MSRKTHLIIVPKDDYETIAANVEKNANKMIRAAKRDARKFGIKAGILYSLMKL